MTVPGGGGDDASSSARKRSRRPEPSTTQRALVLLTRREHSRKELARKLTGRGVEVTEAHAVIDKLTKAGWQDDTRFADLLVRNRAASGYGPGWIRAELGTHGLGSEAVATAIDGFDGDWGENARELVSRRYPAAQRGDRAEQRRAADFLMRRGFAMAHLRAAINPD